MGRRAIAPTQQHELLGKPHQGGAIGVHARQKIKHLVRVAHALCKEITLFLLKAGLCRHSALLTSHRVGRRGATRLEVACATEVSVHLSLWVRVIDIRLDLPRRFAVRAPRSLTASLSTAPVAVELQRSVINSESNYLINANASGGPTAAEFNGLLAVSGTLAQDATSLTFADALSHAYTKIRTGSAFSEPDLVLTSPATAAAALRTKTSTGAYVFDIVRGPGGLNQQNEFDVFGVRTVTSTQVPDGTAIVMSIQGGAAVGWIRMGLELMYNPYGGTTDAGADLWRTNQYGWRAEERVSLSVPPPAAICVVTNLPTS